MKCKFTQSVSVERGTYEEGKVYEVDSKTGAQWVKNGWATETKSADAVAADPQTGRLIPGGPAKKNAKKKD